MDRSGAKFIINQMMAIMVLLACLQTQAQAASPQDQPSQQVNSAVKDRIPPKPPSSLAPSSPGQKPFKSVIITYQNGELTVVAHHSPLNEVLRAIAAQAGAVIAFPPDAVEPVSGRLGPGPVEKIIDSLLWSSGFDYVIQSAADPSAPLRVTLFSKSAGYAATQPIQTPAVTVTASAGNRKAEDDQVLQMIEDRREKVADRRQLIQQMIRKRLWE